VHLASSSLDSAVRLWELPEKAAAKPPVWVMADECTWSRWISLPTPRLACARRQSEGQKEPPADEPPYTYFLQYMLVDFEQQFRLLRRMTYGVLDEDELNTLGLLGIRDTALALTHQGRSCMPQNVSLPAGCTKE
jgi:hypothetical protein